MNIMATATKSAPAATKKQAALVEEILSLQDQAESIDDALAAAKADLVKLLGGEPGASIELEGIALVTTTQQTTTVVDYETLCSTAKPGMLRKLTKNVLDLAKFKHLLAAEALPPEVAALAQDKKGPVFLKITRR